MPPSLHGVSVPMYALLCATTISWATYGVLVGDPLVVVTNLLVLPCAAVVTARAYAYQRRAAIAAVA